MIRDLSLNVGTAATLLAAPTAAGTSLVVANQGAKSIFLGDVGIVVNGGFEIPAGEAYAVDVAPGKSLYGIVASGTAAVLVLEADALASRGSVPVRIAISGSAPPPGTPSLVAAHINGTQLVLTFSAAMAASVPASSAFTVAASGSGGHAISGAPAIAGNTVTLTLTTPVLGSEYVSVAYVAPASNPRLQDNAGNLVASFGPVAVNNDTSGSFPSGGTLVAATLAGLGAGPFNDGQLAIIRIGAWPNIHEEFIKYDAALGKWLGDPITLLTQSDTWAMDLGDKKGTDLLLFGLVKNAIPYGKAYTKLNGTQNANAATINVLARYSGGPAFAATGTILIRDNIITYTGITGAQTGNFSFTGCVLQSGSGGAIPDTVDVTQGFPGGFGMVSSPLPFAAELWAAGLRLQEKMSSFMNGSPEAGGNKALTIAPYWYQYNAGDGYASPVTPPNGGLGFSASVVGSVDPGGPWTAERPFTWAENAWADWAGAGDAGKVPAKRFLLPRIYGKMAAGSIDTGECLDTTLRVRWVSP